ncbi:MAG TPA: phosphatidylglycerophosphatase A [Pyrinomonadaceae bacterium]|nr:phosphatidylglycerophosphatase A [Pyrinomonadaceae bacterium]
MLKKDDPEKAIEERPAKGLTDYVALGLTTFGVGYIPGAPGTYGSAVGVGIYLAIAALDAVYSVRASGVAGYMSMRSALIPIALTAFCLVGIWASGRTAPIFGRKDPSQAVVDEVMGQLITFCFVPFGINWRLVLAGFLLFRLFDIVKPFPVRSLEVLPGGLGICADDIVAGVYAGLCLAAMYAVYFGL